MQPGSRAARHALLFRARRVQQTTDVAAAAAAGSREMSLLAGAEKVGEGFSMGECRDRSVCRPLSRSRSNALTPPTCWCP